MKQVIVEAFGGIEQLQLRESPDPEPGPGQVRVKLISVGLNHADLMARAGQYKIASGPVPFTPGVEGGGLIDAVGQGVSEVRLGQRVTLTPDAPRNAAGGLGGTYRQLYLCASEQALRVPDAIDDDQLGALWLAYLTAYGCLVWQQNLQPGQVVALPAASSSVALAAAQIVKHHGGVAIGLTTSPDKVEAIHALDAAVYDHLVVTHDADRNMLPWHKDLRPIAPKGVDVFFDSVAAGAYLNTEIKCLAQGGCVWVYGLLGATDAVDVTPLIRKQAAIRGWGLSQIVGAGREAWLPACQHILDGFEQGHYQQHVDSTYPLSEVQRAHEAMHQGQHLGKMVLLPHG